MAYREESDVSEGLYEKRVAFMLLIHSTAALLFEFDSSEYDLGRRQEFYPVQTWILQTPPWNFYSIYLSPVLTVDPLGLGGKSTYGMALGSQIRLWESKTPENSLTGLKIKGLYTALGYEYYPRQYSKSFASLWLRIKAFIPLAGKIDCIYASGYGLKGLTFRYGVGFEVKRVTIFLCGETWYAHALGGKHPNFETPYTNAGEILAIIPVFSRKEK